MVFSWNVQNKISKTATLFFVCGFCSVYTLRYFSEPPSQLQPQPPRRRMQQQQQLGSGQDLHHLRTPCTPWLRPKRLKLDGEQHT